MGFVVKGSALPVSFVRRSPDVTEFRRSLAARAMCFFAERVDAAGVDPAVIEVEQRADGDGVIDCRVGPAGFMQRRDIGRTDVDRIAVDFVHKSEESLLGLRERRGFQVFDYRLDQRLVSQQFRRNCGVGLQSKGAIVARRCEGGNEFAQAGTDRSRFAHDRLREALKMLRRMRLKREQMPDLRVFRSVLPGVPDEIAEWAAGFRGFHVAEKHGFHGAEFLILRDQPPAPP